MGEKEKKTEGKKILYLAMCTLTYKRATKKTELSAKKKRKKKYFPFLAIDEKTRNFPPQKPSQAINLLSKKAVKQYFNFFL